MRGSPAAGTRSGNQSHSGGHAIDPTSSSSPLISLPLLPLSPVLFFSRLFPLARTFSGDLFWNGSAQRNRRVTAGWGLIPPGPHARASFRSHSFPPFLSPSETRAGGRGQAIRAVRSEPGDTWREMTGHRERMLRLCSARCGRAEWWEACR